MSTEVIAVADALGAAIAARSAQQFESLYADDVVVWHGATGQSMGKAENIGLLRAVFQLTKELRYVNIRRHVIDGGLLQQHQLTGIFADGKPMPVLEVCMVIKNDGHRIARIEEYFDSQTFAEVWARVAALTAGSSH